MLTLNTLGIDKTYKIPLGRGVLRMKQETRDQTIKDNKLPKHVRDPTNIHQECINFDGQKIRNTLRVQISIASKNSN